jgi:hypothetical protein
MKKLPLLLLFSLLAALAMGQTVTKVELARDNGQGKPGEVVKSFSPADDPIHCVIRVKPLTGPTIFTGTLIAVNAEKYKNFQVATTNVSGIASTTSVDFKFRVGGSWPAGSYRIELKANGKALRDVTFEIR